MLPISTLSRAASDKEELHSASSPVPNMDTATITEAGAPLKALQFKAPAQGAEEEGAAEVGVREEGLQKGSGRRRGRQAKRGLPPPVFILDDDPEPDPGIKPAYNRALRC